MPGDFASGRADNCPTPSDSKAYYANSICMNRNRDLNGNDTIDADEIRWYLPTSSDYMQIGICQSELPTPLMKFTDYDPNMFVAGYSAGGYYVYGTFNYHYVTSDYQYYFAEQCVNTGDYLFSGYWATASAANTARCIRNLGTDPAQKPEYGVNEVDNAFSYDSNTRIFNQYNFRDESLRGYTLGGLAPHDTSSPTFRPYKKFEVAKNYCRASDEYIRFNQALSFVNATSDHDRTVAWTNSLEKNGICGQYYQDDDKSQIGTWRIPSASELALMWIEGLPQADDKYYLSATHDYFVSYDLRNFATDNKFYLGYNNYGDRKVMALDVLGKLGNGIYLRCVRDVR
jgi:hypothetical protein